MNLEAQGTMLVEVLEPQSTDAKGHWLKLLRRKFGGLPGAQKDQGHSLGALQGGRWERVSRQVSGLGIWKVVLKADECVPQRKGVQVGEGPGGR